MAQCLGVWHTNISAAFHDTGLPSALRRGPVLGYLLGLQLLYCSAKPKPPNV